MFYVVKKCGVASEVIIRWIVQVTLREMLTPVSGTVLTVLIAGVAVFVYSGVREGIFLFQLPSEMILRLCVYD